jgi:phosphohistidine phosphatase
MVGVQRTLVILRHAKSAWPDGVADIDRPLGDRGLRDAPAAGRWLAEHAPDIDVVLCSPARRTRQTWGLVSAELGGSPSVDYDDRLYGASDEELIAVARELRGGASTVLVIGHNPGLEELVSLLTGSPHSLKTSAIAVLEGHGDWSDIGPGWSRLAASATPRG